MLYHWIYRESSGKYEILEIDGDKPWFEFKGFSNKNLETPNVPRCSTCIPWISMSITAPLPRMSKNRIQSGIMQRQQMAFGWGGWYKWCQDLFFRCFDVLRREGSQVPFPFLTIKHHDAHHSQAKSKPVGPVDEWRLFDRSPRLNAVPVAMQSHNAATHAWSLHHMGKHSSLFLEEAKKNGMFFGWMSVDNIGMYVCLSVCMYVCM